MEHVAGKNLILPAVVKRHARLFPQGRRRGGVGTPAHEKRGETGYGDGPSFLRFEMRAGNPRVPPCKKTSQPRASGRLRGKNWSGQEDSGEERKAGAIRHGRQVYIFSPGPGRGLTSIPASVRGKHQECVFEADRAMASVFKAASSRCRMLFPYPFRVMNSRSTC